MKRLIKIIFLFTLMFITLEVDAKTVTLYFCWNDSRYQVDYNDEYVNISDIDITAIQNGYVNNPLGANDKNYKITSIFLDNNCSNVNGNVTSCPTSKLANEFKTGGAYSDDSDYATIEYNVSTGRFDVKIKNIFNNQVYIRKVPNESKRNTGRVSKSAYSDSEFLSLRNGYYSLTAGFNEEIRLEFYEKSSNACNGSFIWETALFTPGEEGITIKNPAVNNANSNAYKVCQKMKHDNTILNDATIRQNVAYLCYDEDISLDDYNNLVIKINEQYNRLKDEFKNVSSNDNGIISSSVTGQCSSGSGETKCAGTTSKSKSYTLYSNSNFAVTCTETAKSTGDTPKLTTAGSGFSYDVTYTVERTCKISFIGSPARLKPQCKCRAEAINDHWDTSGKWQGTNQGGPKEDFDSCVTTCDGGKYSQSCINSCYQEVYGEDDKRSEKIEKMSFNLESEKTASFLKDTKDKNYSVQKIETITWDGGSGGGFEYEGETITSSGNSGSQYSYKKSCSFKYSNKCGSHGTRIKIVVYPSGCSWNPWGEYRSAVNGKKSDYNSALSRLAKAIDDDEIITYKIVDSALKTKDGKYYTFTVNSKDNPLVVKNISQGGRSSSNGSATIGNQGDSVKLHKNTFTRTISAKLPQAYLEKISGKALYTSNNRGFEIDNTNNRLVATNYDVRDFYNGGNKYFTSIYSNNINTVKNANGDIELVKDKPCYNIEVSVTNLGTGGRFAMSNSCYYGVYNNYIETLPPGDVCNTGETCIGDSGGQVGDIKYIFRPIELTDVFPEREPRWNWTDDASLNLNGKDPYLGYNVYPSKTNIGIEERGHTIINDANQEVDYEIIIGRGNIASIKSYNKDVSYTEFSLNCRDSNYRSCRSTFLDSAAYIKNAGNVRKNAKLGTNND